MSTVTITPVTSITSINSIKPEHLDCYELSLGPYGTFAGFRKLPACRLLIVTVDKGDDHPQHLALHDLTLPKGTVPLVPTPLMERFLAAYVEDDLDAFEVAEHVPYCRKDVVCLDCSELFCSRHCCVGGLKHAGHRRVFKTLAVPAINLVEEEGEEAGDEPMGPAGTDCYITLCDIQRACPHSGWGTSKNRCIDCRTTKTMPIYFSAYVKASDEDEMCRICTDVLKTGSTIVNCSNCLHYMCERCWDSYHFVRRGSVTLCPFCNCVM